MGNISTNNNTKAIMQIQMDQNNAETVAQDLREYAIILSNALGYKTEEIVDEMSRHDLDHLINTFKKYFHEYVELLDSDNIVIQQDSK
jgi:hypothetical protein